VRTPFTGRIFARKAERRSRDRGSRIKAVFATGSYEGSLTMEGIPAVTSHCSSRFSGHGGLGGFLLVWSTRNLLFAERPRVDRVTPSTLEGV
jgi:hypothetical protein